MPKDDSSELDVTFHDRRCQAFVDDWPTRIVWVEHSGKFVDVSDGKSLDGLTQHTYAGHVFAAVLDDDTVIKKWTMTSSEKAYHLDDEDYYGMLKTRAFGGTLI